MLALFCISSVSKLVVFSSILVSFSLPGAPLEPPGPPFFLDGIPGRFFYDFLGVPGEAVGRLWGPLGSRGATLGPTLTPKVGIKAVIGPKRCKKCAKTRKTENQKSRTRESRDQSNCFNQTIEIVKLID